MACIFVRRRGRGQFDSSLDPVFCLVTTNHLQPGTRKESRQLSGCERWEFARSTQSRKCGNLNDVLILHAEHLKPNTGFELFTVQNRSLLANGTPDRNFKNFGLAWYQSDLQTDSKGRVDVTIETILWDQIFGFDPVVGLGPTNTFHVGFWFNNPEDAAACSFDPTHQTPFNGEHKARLAAMISLPDPVTDLGPSCTNPEQQGAVFVCNP